MPPPPGRIPSLISESPNRAFVEANSDVAGEGEFEAATEAISFDDCDDRFRTADEGIGDELDAIGDP